MTVGKVHQYRPNYTGLVWGRDCCVSFNTIQSVLLPTYQRILPRKACRLDGKTFEGKPRIWPGLRGGEWKKAYDSDEKMIHFADGSFIEFKSYEQGQAAMQGPLRHIIRMDEEPTEYIFNENQVRQITIRKNIIMTMTPLNYSQWLYGQVYEAAAHNPKIAVFKMSSTENPYANAEVLASMEKDISDPVERAARLHGEFTYAQGRVWKEYGDHNVVPAALIPRDWHRSLIIDPHQEKPTAVNWVAEDHEGRLFVYREGDYKGDVEQIANQIKTQCCGEYIDMVLIDPSSRASAAIRGKGALIDEFRKYFPGVIEANNNRDLGWDIVRKMVRLGPSGPKLFVMDNCPVTDFQMRNYSWKAPLATGESRNKPEVVKRNDDHCDCLRYRCMAKFARGNESFSGFNIGVYANG